MDSVCAKKELICCLNSGAIFHLVQIKERKKLFLAVALQCFAELQKHTGTSLRVESGWGRLLMRRILCRQDDARKAAR